MTIQHAARVNLSRKCLTQHVGHNEGGFVLATQIAQQLNHADKPGVTKWDMTAYHSSGIYGADPFKTLSPKAADRTEAGCIYPSGCVAHENLPIAK